MLMKKRLLIMSLAMALLLAGCGGGPSAVEGAETSAAPEVTAPAVQDAQTPQESQETAVESAPTIDISTWDDMWLINGDVIVARGTDGACVILNSKGEPQKAIAECTSVTLLNQYCFAGISDGTYNLYDLTGTVILTNQTGFHRALSTQDDPWGVIMYEVAEQSDFGGKTTTHFMRTDRFEDIYQIDGNESSAMGMLRYDGTQYLIKSQDTNLGKDIYSTIDGIELPEYQEVDPFMARAEYATFLSGLDYRKTEIVGNGIGALCTTSDNTTDIYNGNHDLCASCDSQVQLSPNTPVGNLGLLATYTSASGHQTGVFDFEIGTFLLVVEGSTTNGALQPKVVYDKYGNEPSAFFLLNTDDLHTLVCANGALVENVDFPAHLYLSSAGYVLVTSTAEPDKLMVINLANGEIESEFQAHLRKEEHT